MNKISEWLQSSDYKEYRIGKALADASFRKYYRLTNGEKKALLMDSSLEMESFKHFLHVHKILSNADVAVPKILDENLNDGFLILEDFGQIHYLDMLNLENFKSLYAKAINTILKMQKADATSLPLYNREFLHFEMELMQEWYLKGLLGLEINEQQKNIIDKAVETVSKIVLEQPQGVFVHRDFHSRNIMLQEDNKIGIIDFQDAMNGAITYDLVSLLKDCYIAYERAEIRKLVLDFRDKKGLGAIDDDTFMKWFDFMGLQRHIKVLGIFSRLYLRDSKNGYLKDIPLTLKYVLDTASRYSETAQFATFLKEHYELTMAKIAAKI